MWTQLQQVHDMGISSESPIRGFNFLIQHGSVISQKTVDKGSIFEGQLSRATMGLRAVEYHTDAKTVCKSNSH